MLNGHMSEMLRVDLTSGEVRKEPLQPGWDRQFLGGSGLAARYLLDAVDRATDPLGPTNPLIFGTSPMVGTAMPSAGRYSVCALSPQTGIWGEANSGGFFGPELRFAGYDGIIITGTAASPVWLSIVDGRAQLLDASDLWGLDCYETQERCKQALSEPRARVACIGVAGENQVRYAAVMNDHGRAAARTGMGAVMGSKGLKAIAVRGSARVPVADPAGLKAVVDEILADPDGDMTAMALRLAGTAGYVDMGLMYGDVPIRYFQQGEWEEASNLSGVLMAERFQNKSRACYRCPIACGQETRAPAYGLDRVDGPEYETLAALGAQLMIDDLEAVIAFGNLCNALGMDTISVGVTIGLACEMYQRGILGSADTDGLELRFGDAAMVLRLLGMIARREGVGDLLAQGAQALADAYGVPELAVTVNGLEVPMHDPRAFSAMAAIYALSPRGACHLQGDMYGIDTGQNVVAELGITPGDRFDSSAAKGRVLARQHAWRNVYNALDLCTFQNPGGGRVAAALAAITGWDVDLEELMATGQRILALKRLLNLRRGLTRNDERMPALLTIPLQGGTEGNVADLDPLLAGAYDELGWNLDTGRPKESTLSRLGLDSESGKRGPRDAAAAGRGTRLT